MIYVVIDMMCPHCGFEWKREYQNKVPSDFLRQYELYKEKGEQLDEKWKIIEFLEVECNYDNHTFDHKFEQKSEDFKKAYRLWHILRKKEQKAFHEYEKRAEKQHIEQVKDGVLLEKEKITFEEYMEKYDLKTII